MSKSPYVEAISDTPQSEPVDPRQVPNNAGGFTFAVDTWTRLDRFVILGADTPTFYVSARKLTLDNVASLRAAIAENGIRTVQRIVEISEAGRAPRNDAAVFALAVCAAEGSPEVKTLALGQMPRVCRIGTHVFQFVEALNALRGWGRQARRMVGRWYTDKAAKDLAYQVLKYQQRDGWSHRDVLRLAHPKLRAETPELEQKQAILRWVAARDFVGKERPVRRSFVPKIPKMRGFAEYVYPATADAPALLQAYEQLLRTTDAASAAVLIHAHKLTHEMVPGELKQHAEVWAALANHMPMHAMARNLGQLTAKQVLTSGNAATERVVTLLSDQAAVQRSRLHPIALLMASKTYAAGQGDKGKLTWKPLKAVQAALDRAFYLSFKNIVPSGKRTLLALDVSGSMGYAPSSPLTPREITAAMAMAVARSEPHWKVMGFSSRFIEIPITPEMTLDAVTKAVSNLPFESTDCSLPFTWGRQQKDAFDVVQIWTDNETYAGKVHPHVALQKYRQTKGTDTKLAVCATTSTGFSIAVPDDPGMLDCVGFDSSVPALLADFARGGTVNAT